jgi:serine/threonine protein kinase
MALPTGTRIGPYEVTGALGAGGMGEVYRARDARLNRDVAIKALQPAVAADPERIARFEREAQLLASLHHPNIAGIHGLEEATGSGQSATYLVLEFVDGKPLDALLRDTGALPPVEAVAIARQIADAIAAAHEKGIIHRDLKPGNVMVTADGQVKVLDFGLGKSIDDGRPAPGETTPSNSPTMTLGATQAGIILGTAGYMSPEQAKGRAADRRSDVWSFGCLLFELLAGSRAFQGDDVTDTIAAIVRGEPAWKALPGDHASCDPAADRAVPYEGPPAAAVRHVRRAVRTERIRYSRDEPHDQCRGS